MTAPGGPRWDEVRGAEFERLVNVYGRAVQEYVESDGDRDGEGMTIAYKAVLARYRSDLTAAYPALREIVIEECADIVRRVRVSEENRHLTENRDRRTVPALVDAAHHCGEAVEVALHALLDTGDAGTEKGVK